MRFLRETFCALLAHGKRASCGLAETGHEDHVIFCQSMKSKFVLVMTLYNVSLATTYDCR